MPRELQASGKRNPRAPYTGFNHSIAQPPHASCLFDAIFRGVTEFAVDVRSDFIGIEPDRFQRGSEGERQRRLPAPGSPMIKILRFTGDTRRGVSMRNPSSC